MTDQDDARIFAEDVDRRACAARGLERDLLTEVPMLYGSPGTLEQNGDPGIALAKLHRDELVRRNGGGIPRSAKNARSAALPYERMMLAIAAVLILVQFLD